MNQSLMSFSPFLAISIGLESAIILQIMRDGLRCESSVTKSLTEWYELLPFLSKSKITISLKKLKKLKLIKSEPNVNFCGLHEDAPISYSINYINLNSFCKV